MNYLQHYEASKAAWQDRNAADSQVSPEAFRAASFMRTDMFTRDWTGKREPISTVKKLMGEVDRAYEKHEPWMPKGNAKRAFLHTDALPDKPMFEELRESISEICNLLFYKLERSHFGCSLHLQRASILRSKISEHAPNTSELWHTDNYPKTVHKLILYLTDVEEEDGPLEYKVTDKGALVWIDPMKTGPGQWTKPKRKRELGLPASQEKLGSKTFTGCAGSAIVFCPNFLHRRKVPTVGGRTVLMLTFRPTIEPKTPYLDERWTCVWQPPGGGLEPLPTDPRHTWPPAVVPRAKKVK
jgi:hypothetical protein